MNMYDLYDALTRLWPDVEKDVVLQLTRQDRYLEFSFAHEVGQYRLWVSLLVGPRKGLQEFTFLLDMSKLQCADQIILCECNNYLTTHILDLYDAHEQIRGKNSDPLTVCRTVMQARIDWIVQHPDITESLLRHLSPNPCSVKTISGGLPSLGRASK